MTGRFDRGERGGRGAQLLLRMILRVEHDVFVIRQRGREVAVALGMEEQDRVRVATALSEVGRDLLRTGRVATVDFEVRLDEQPALAIVLESTGAAGPRSDGVAAAARLMDGVEVTEDRIVLTRRLPAPVTDQRLAEVRAELASSRPTSALDELSVQNQQLLVALEQVQAHRDELLQLNAELEETNKGVMALYGQLSQELEQTNQGVVALYAELEERSARLREASEAKSRFLANVSHELRAPVTAIIGLTRLLLDPHSDPLSGEQTHQLHLVQTSAADLLARVNDLLDLAKAEANLIMPAWSEVDLAAVFGQLRGTLRPLAKPDVELVIDEVSLTIVTDEVLLAQILRNLLTNALKFTASGEVRLSAAIDGDRVKLAVSDTGIGIAVAEQSRVFEEFHQVRGVHQVGGTGLGLPYARRLAALLGGALTLTSTPDEGSVFTVDLPLRPPTETIDEEDMPRIGKALLVDDDAAARHRLRRALDGMVETFLEAADGHSALAIAQRERPDVIFLVMPGGDGPEMLAGLAASEELRRVPVIVVTAAELTQFAPDALAHATVVVRKGEVSRGVIATVLRAAVAVEDG